MSGQLSRPIELFDEVRGDIFSVCREDFLEIYEYDDKDFLEVLRGLGAFFVGNKGDPEPEIKARDKRNVGVIKRLIDHQKVNAMRELNRKKSGKGAADARWSNNPKSTPKNATVCERILNNATALDKAKAEDKDEASKSLSSVDGAERDGLKPPVCPSLSVTEAKKTLAMDAPEIKSHKEMQTSSGKPNAKCHEFIMADADKTMLMVATEIYPNALDEIGGDAADTLQSVLDGENNDGYEDWDLPKSFHKTPIGGFLKTAFSSANEICKAYSVSDENTSLDKMESVFKRAIVAAYLASQDPKVKNQAAFIIARLKKVLEAVKVLEGANPEQPQDQKPLTEADY